MAERKVRGILGYGGTVRLVAEALNSWLQAQCDKGTVLLLGSVYTRDQLQDVDLVFAATSDLALNRTIAEDAKRCRLWCNMATDPESGSFIVPSTVRRGPLTIAVSTAGASPAMAIQIRQKLEREFGAEWGVLLRLLALLRKTIQEKGLDPVENQDLYRRIGGLPLLEWIQRHEKIALIEAIAEICHPRLGLMELTQMWNLAWNQSS